MQIKMQHINTHHNKQTNTTKPNTTQHNTSQTQRHHRQHRYNHPPHKQNIQTQKQTTTSSQSRRTNLRPPIGSTLLGAWSSKRVALARSLPLLEVGVREAGCFEWERLGIVGGAVGGREGSRVTLTQTQEEREWVVARHGLRRVELVAGTKALESR